MKIKTHDNSTCKGRTSVKKKIKNSGKQLVNVAEIHENENMAEPASAVDLETDISQLEPPTFTTITKQQPETMMRLNWDHEVNLIGDKVPNPMIHCCDTCLKPILIYGRLIPCKHIFCLECAKKEEKICGRCKQKVARVEQTGLGSVFMCTFEGSRYGNGGCRRTYLSPRDLQAHINHRHNPSTLNAKSTSAKEGSKKSTKLYTNAAATPIPESPPVTKHKQSPVAQSIQSVASAGDPRLYGSNRRTSPARSKRHLHQTDSHSQVEKPQFQSNNHHLQQSQQIQHTPRDYLQSPAHHDQPFVSTSLSSQQRHDQFIPVSLPSQSHLQTTYQSHSNYMNQNSSQQLMMTDYETNSLAARRNLITVPIDNDEALRRPFCDPSYMQNNSNEYTHGNNTYSTQSMVPQPVPPPLFFPNQGTPYQNSATFVPGHLSNMNQIIGQTFPQVQSHPRLQINSSMQPHPQIQPRPTVQSHPSVQPPPPGVHPIRPLPQWHQPVNSQQQYY